IHAKRRLGLLTHVNIKETEDKSKEKRFEEALIVEIFLRTPQCSEAYLHWRSALLSTMYLPTTSESSAGDSSFESSARPSPKRCRSPVATEASQDTKFSDLEDYSKEEVAETIAETMEQYMSKTRADYRSGIARPKIDNKDHFKLKGQLLKELRDNTFSGSNHEDANGHIEKVLEIVDLFHIPNITQDQVMLRSFPMSLTGAAVTTWEDLKTKFISKYCPPARSTKKMEKINNFQQEPDKTLYQAWERFKELLIKCPQYYLIEIQAPSKKWLNTLKNGTMQYIGQEALKLLTDELVENMDGYRDQDIGDIILGEPFFKSSVEARRFDGLITVHNGNDNVTYQMVRSHPRFKHLSNAQCNKIKPLLKDLNMSEMRKMEEWLTRGHISVHEME
nr:hypothetical protein [Tanacetum cinerariifolium]